LSNGAYLATGPSLTEAVHLPEIYLASTKLSFPKPRICHISDNAGTKALLQCVQKKHAPSRIHFS